MSLFLKNLLVSKQDLNASRFALVLTALQIYVLKNQIMLFASYLLPESKQKKD